MKQYDRSSKYFKNETECIKDALDNFQFPVIQDMSQSLSYPYLYLIEYNELNGVMTRCHRVNPSDYNAARVYYRSMWVYSPDPASMWIHNLKPVQCEISDINFPDADLCKHHAQCGGIDLPSCWGGPYLHILEYNNLHGKLESATLV